MLVKVGLWFVCGCGRAARGAQTLKITIQNGLDPQIHTTKINILIEILLNSLCFTIRNQLVCLGLAWFAPKWFRAITWTIWLHFQIRDRGSAWFFGAHILYFWSRGPDFGPRIQILDPGFQNLARAGPGTFLGLKWGTEEHGFVLEMVPKSRIWGIP